MCRHAGFRWGELVGGNSLAAQECAAAGVALWVVWFVCYDMITSLFMKLGLYFHVALQSFRTSDPMS